MAGTAPVRGFTLIELLLLVAVIAITLPMAGAVFQEQSVTDQHGRGVRDSRGQGHRE